VTKARVISSRRRSPPLSVGRLFAWRVPDLQLIEQFIKPLAALLAVEW